MKRTIVIGMALALLTACTTTGALKPKYVPEAAIQAVPSSEGPPDFYSSADWFPDTQGFMQERSLAMIPARVGVILVNKQALYFVQLNSYEDKYRVLLRISLDEIVDVAADDLGGNRRVVVYTKSRSNTFGVFRNGSGATDEAATEKLLSVIKQMHKAVAN